MADPLPDQLPIKGHDQQYVAPYVDTPGNEIVVTNPPIVYQEGKVDHAS